MKVKSFIAILIAIGTYFTSPAFSESLSPQDFSGEPDWAMNVTIIEACSCPMFCQCFFNTSPASHSSHGMSEAYCKGNLAFKVNSGYYGDVKLEGTKFWTAGDLGADFSQGEVDWIVMTFDPSVTKEQREAIGMIMQKIYPFKAKSFTIADDKTVDWSANKDNAEAKLDGGKAGEIVLKRYPGNTDEPIVITNLKYAGAPRNDGFNLMPNEIETYKLGDKAFEFKGTNGFTVTIDINSKDKLESWH